MLSRFAFTTGLLLSSSCALAGVQSYYCPQNHGYISVGMTPTQVLAACGQPLSQQESNQPVMQRVPVQQLMYNNVGSPKTFYGVWAISSGINSGVQLQVNIVDNKVKSVSINGSGTNAFSVCGNNIEVGDPAYKVYGSCGNPSAINNSFLNQPIQSNKRPQIWIYQTSEFQSPVTLTFANGKLQSID